MANKPTALIVLAAGKGKRMQSTIPKVLQKLAGKSMLMHIIDNSFMLNALHTVVVIGKNSDIIKNTIPSYCTTVTQFEQLGTAHAAMQASNILKNFKGNVIILCGDVPFISLNTLKKLLKSNKTYNLSVLGFQTATPKGYGRIILNKSKEVISVIEEKDLRKTDKFTNYLNSGIISGDWGFISKYVKKICSNKQDKEYYLTDIFALAEKDGLPAKMIEGKELELMGVNDKKTLASAESHLQKVLKDKAMRRGVTFINPNSVILSSDTYLGKDVIVEPNVYFGNNVKIRSDVVIKSNSYLEGVIINSGSQIGPYARIRPNTTIGKNVKIGNFVEIKNSKISNHVKVNHLSYIGDAFIGINTNIGAGTITCNYDGYEKHITKIGSDTFIGSNTSLVAPLTIGSGVVIGAGSTITKNVPNNKLAVSREKQFISKNDYKYKKFTKRKKN